MAWCERCGESVSEADASADAEDVSHCPRCGGALAPGDEERHVRAPWHFKVLVVATVIYLIYRVIWFGFWLSHHA